MRFLIFIKYIKSEQNPINIYIQSPRDTLYLGNKNKMEKYKTIFKIEKSKENGVIKQSLRNIKTKELLIFKLEKSKDNKTENKKNITFNFIDMSTNKGKIMIGDNCLIRKKDNTVVVRTCSNSIKNENEIFIIKNEKNVIEDNKKSPTVKTIEEDSNSFKSENEEEESKKSEIVNEDSKISTENNSKDELISEENTNIKKSKIRKKPQIKKKGDSKILEEKENIDKNHLIKKDLNNEHHNYISMIERLQYIISELTKKLSKQDEEESKHNKESKPKQDEEESKHNKESKPKQDEEESKHNKENSYKLGDENDIENNSIIEDESYKILSELKERTKKIFKMVDNIKSGNINIDTIIIELRSILEQVRNIRLEYIQKAQNKANNYLMKINKLSSKLINLEAALKKIKMSPQTLLNQLNTFTGIQIGGNL